MRCDDYCCNHGCNQGRHCPARQACQLPEEDPPVMQTIKDALKGLIMAVALVIMCLAVAFILIPPL